MTALFDAATHTAIQRYQNPSKVQDANKYEEDAQVRQCSALTMILKAVASRNYDIYECENTRCAKSQNPDRSNLLDYKRRLFCLYKNNLGHQTQLRNILS